MKNILIIISLLVGTECFAGGPFFPYKDNRPLDEAIDSVVNNKVVLAEYVRVFQNLSEHQGWIKDLPNKKVSTDLAVAFLRRLEVYEISWKAGEKKIGELDNPDSIGWCYRASKGTERVGFFNYTDATGRLMENGNAYQSANIMLLRCVNSIEDIQMICLPPSSTVTQKEQEKEEMVEEIVEDTTFLVEDTKPVKKPGFSKPKPIRQERNAGESSFTPAENNRRGPGYEYSNSSYSAGSGVVHHPYPQRYPQGQGNQVNIWIGVGPPPPHCH